MEDFSDFFFDLKPLSEEQIKKLNQWKSVDETWWNLVKYTPSYKAESSIYIDAEKYAQFFVFYGKSLLLESACLISQGKYKESQEILNYLIKISWELETFYYIFNPPPIAVQSGSKINLMSIALNKIIQSKTEKK